MATTRQFEYLGTGRHRIVFRHGNWAIKIPLNYNGGIDNDREARIFKRHGNKPDQDEIQYARCRLIPGSFPPILVMEYVAPLEEKDRPKWADYVDCGQVGKTISGRVVAFDFGF